MSLRFRHFLLALLEIGCGRQEPSTAAPIANEARAPSNDPAAPGAADGTAAGTPAGASSDKPSKATKAAPEGPFNVMLILVDSMRADMPWAGYPRAIAPNLTALERESISYARAYSVSSYTAKSVAALLSSKYPSTLKRSGYFFTKYPASNLFFPELLEAAGIHTLSAQAHAYMKRGNGLDQGFVVWDLVPGITFDAQTDRHITSEKLTPLIQKQLEAVPASKPFFLYAHYMDPHDQYMKHTEAPAFGKQSRDLYDGEVFYTDLHLGKLFDWCKTRPFWQKTAVIVSADHGEAFGEHNMSRHAFALWDMLTHVPLFVRLPGAEPRKIDVPRSHVDIGPTVLELMGVKAAHDFVGRSLVPELHGAAPEPRPVLLDLPADSNNPESRALIAGDYKLMVLGNDYRFELFNLKSDPGETKNLAKQEPEKLAELKRVYGEVWGKLKKVKPFGGNKLVGGGAATGPAE